MFLHTAYYRIVHLTSIRRHSEKSQLKCQHACATCFWINYASGISYLSRLQLLWLTTETEADNHFSDFALCSSVDYTRCLYVKCCDGGQRHQRFVK